MVVLEGGGMLSSASNQYLQPDYLSPLPTTLDAKKSPLALLAQTCSQIGADSPPSKSLLASLDKPKKSESRSSPASRESKNSVSIHHHRSTPTNNNNNTSSSPPTEQKLAFKPYETNVLTPKKEESSPRPASKASSSHGSEHDKKSGTPTPMDRKTVSPSNSATPSATATGDNGKQSPSTEKSGSPQGRGASPIIRSGLEILQGHKDSALGYKHLSQGLPSSLQGFYPPGLEHTNPAFRPSFPGAPYGSSAHHHAAAAAMLGYSGSAPTPYLSYARVKTPSGGEALVPVCKDPYCTGCQFSMHNQQMLMNAAAAGGAAAQGPCPSGCTQCDHQKYNLAMAMSLGHPSSLAAYSQLGRPYVCSWIVGDNYCGKRFVTSEELLQHLRTHTSGSDAAAAAAAAAVTSASSAMLSPHLFSRPGYPNPPLSPLSAARFHPYGKPPLPTSLPASPYSAFNPTALAPYYSPYSIYGQRLGAAAVHP